MDKGHGKEEGQAGAENLTSRHKTARHRTKLVILWRLLCYLHSVYIASRTRKDTWAICVIYIGYRAGRGVAVEATPSHKYLQSPPPPLLSSFCCLTTTSLFLAAFSSAHPCSTTAVEFN